MLVWCHIVQLDINKIVININRVKKRKINFKVKNWLILTKCTGNYVSQFDIYKIVINFNS